MTIVLFCGATAARRIGY